MSFEINADSANGRDFYGMFGVSRYATAAEIKKAYRKKALKVHPDRNIHDPLAKAKFQEISEIYSILSDATKRQIYDTHGEAGLKSRGFGFDPENCNVDDLLSAVFGDDDDSKNSGGTANSSLAELSVDVALSELYNGTSRRIEFSYQYMCDECNGSGRVRTDVEHVCRCCGGNKMVTESCRQKQTCEDCHGGGVLKPPFVCNCCNGAGFTSSWNSGQYSCRNCAGAGKMNFVQCSKCDGKGQHRVGVTKMSWAKCDDCCGKGKKYRMDCGKCRGQGEYSATKDISVQCKKCNGRGFNTSSKSTSCRQCRGQKQFTAFGTATVEIPRGTRHTEILHVQHSDHQRSVYGVVSVTVNCTDIAQSRFIVQEDDLLTFHTISLWQALLGGDFVFEHVNGDKLAVQRGQDLNVGFGEFKKIANAGMPKKGIPNAFGDLFIKFRIEMPKMHQLTDDQRQQIRELCRGLSLSNTHRNVSNYKQNDPARKVHLSDLTGFEKMAVAASEGKVIAKMTETKDEKGATDFCNSATGERRRQKKKGEEQAPECKQM